MKPSGGWGWLLLCFTILAGGMCAGGAEIGTLSCLRGGRTNSLTVCLSCHDGSLAHDLKLTAPAQKSANACGEHPVPVAYAAAYTRRPTEFVAPGLLPPQIQLVQGEVQCVTCHQTNARGEWVAVRGEAGRPLCLSCHRK